jgi:CBS domain-containing protein
MAAFKIGSALVVEDDIVTGIFTTHDALRALIHLSGR